MKRRNTRKDDNDPEMNSYATTHLSHLMPVGLILLLCLSDTMASQQTTTAKIDDMIFSKAFVNETMKLPEVTSNEDMKKCDSLVSLVDYITGYRTMSWKEREKPSGHGVYQFPFGDMKIPLTLPNTNINSALNFISKISNTFEGLESNFEDEKNMIQFTQNTIYFSGINITMIDMHIYEADEPKFMVGLNIANVSLVGRFHYYGPLAMSELPLEGNYRMTIEDAHIVSSSNLTKRLNETGDPELKTNNFKLNITNMGFIDITIFDGVNAISPTSNPLFRIFQRLLQKTIKRTYYAFEEYIVRSLTHQSRESIDCELRHYSPILDNKNPIGREDFQRILRLEVVRTNMSLVPIGDFQHTQTVLGTNATITFTNGTMSGLNEVHFNNDTRVKLEQKSIYIRSIIGWEGLAHHYNWELDVGGRTGLAKGRVSFKTKIIEFDSVITKNVHGIKVEKLDIIKFEQPQVDISGAPLNRLTRGIVNFFLARMKGRLRDTIQPVIKGRLEYQLDAFRDMI